MKIAIVGGGPGGLYFAALMKQLDPAHEIAVWERNAPDDTFGFGVVFSDETLGGIENADPEFADAMARRFARWTDIDIHYRGRSHTIGGQGFAAMSRKDLLRLLQERCRKLGVSVHYSTLAPPVDELSASYDLVVGADGLNSQVRAARADVFRPSLDRRHNRYMWLGTDRVFEAFQFFVRQTEWGTMQVHGYPYSETGSTFIVEMHEDVWRRAGFDDTEETEFPPGASDERAVERVRGLFAEELVNTRCSPTTRSGSTSPPYATNGGTTATSSSSATPRTPRTSRSVRAPSWPWRTRSPSPPVCTNTPTSRGR